MRHTQWNKTKFNYRNGCKLCNLENIEIDRVNKAVFLNKRNERQSLCIPVACFDSFLVSCAPPKKLE